MNSSPDSLQQPCPCGSGAAYGDCCGRYHRGLAQAPTAEALMRSRYAAYAKGLAEYLLATWHAGSRPERLDLGGEGNPWRGLEILRCEAGGEEDASGLVEFRARWQEGGRRGCLHETSRFLREAGRWSYVAGEIHPEPAAVKVGRNDPCPCGSGRKYKRCCGA